MCEPGSHESHRPRETDCGSFGSAEPVRWWRRLHQHRRSGLAMLELPGVVEDGMPGENGQRKLGTTRGSPRRSRTAKASRISRPAVKSRCAREWGGWGRLSEDGPGQQNPDPSEGPWGGGRPTLQGGASSWSAARRSTGQPLRPCGARRATANRASAGVCREQA